eukprot:Skav228072  [mRNA]  locus=scaffold52:118984:122494:+ [translate_table: standard]
MSPRSTATTKTRRPKPPVQARSSWQKLLSEKTRESSRSGSSGCCCWKSRGSLPVVRGNSAPRNHWLVATGSEDCRLVIWLLRQLRQGYTSVITGHGMAWAAFAQEYLEPGASARSPRRRLGAP